MTLLAMFISVAHPQALAGRLLTLHADSHFLCPYLGEKCKFVGRMWTSITRHFVVEKNESVFRYKSMRNVVSPLHLFFLSYPLSGLSQLLLFVLNHALLFLFVPIFFFVIIHSFHHSFPRRVPTIVHIYCIFISGLSCILFRCLYLLFFVHFLCCNSFCINPSM